MEKQDLGHETFFSLLLFHFRIRKCNTTMIIVLRLFRMNIYSNDDAGAFSLLLFVCSLEEF